MIRQSYGMTYVGCGELGFSTSECCSDCKTVADWPFTEVLYANPPLPATQDPAYYPLGIGGIVCCHHLHAARSLSRDTWIQIARRYGARIGSTRADLARVSRSSTPKHSNTPREPSRQRSRACIFCGRSSQGSICDVCNKG